MCHRIAYEQHDAMGVIFHMVSGDMMDGGWLSADARDAAYAAPNDRTLRPVPTLLTARLQAKRPLSQRPPSEPEPLKPKPQWMPV